MVERQGSRQALAAAAAAATACSHPCGSGSKKRGGGASGPARALELICIVWALCIIYIVQASLHALLCVAPDTTLHIACMSP